MSDPPRLHFPVSSSSFKRSFEEYGIDLDSPQETTPSNGPPWSSSSGSGSRSGSSAVNGESERTKRQRSDATSSSSILDHPVASSSSSSSSSSSRTIAATSHPIPIPSPLSFQDSPPFVTRIHSPSRPAPQRDEIMLGSLLPLRRPRSPTPPRPSANEERYRVSMERFNAFDSEISALRHRHVPDRRSPSPPPTLPPLLLPRLHFEPEAPEATESSFTIPPSPPTLPAYQPLEPLDASLNFENISESHVRLRHRSPSTSRGRSHVSRRLIPSPQNDTETARGRQGPSRRRPPSPHPEHMNPAESAGGAVTSSRGYLFSRHPTPPRARHIPLDDRRTDFGDPPRSRERIRIEEYMHARRIRQRAVLEALDELVDIPSALEAYERLTSSSSLSRRLPQRSRDSHPDLVGDLGAALRNLSDSNSPDEARSSVSHEHVTDYSVSPSSLSPRSPSETVHNEWQLPPLPLPNNFDEMPLLRGSDGPPPHQNRSPVIISRRSDEYLAPLFRFTERDDRNSGQAFSLHEHADFYHVHRSPQLPPPIAINRLALGTQDSALVQPGLAPPPSPPTDPPFMDEAVDAYASHHNPSVPADDHRVRDTNQSRPLPERTAFPDPEEFTFDPLAFLPIHELDSDERERRRHVRNAARSPHVFAPSPPAPPRVPSPRPTSPFEDSFIRSLQDGLSDFHRSFPEPYNAEWRASAHLRRYRGSPDFWHPQAFPLSTSAELRRRTSMYAAGAPPRHSPPPVSRLRPLSSYAHSSSVNASRNAVTIPDVGTATRRSGVTEGSTETRGRPSTSGPTLRHLRNASDAPRIDLSVYREGPFRSSLVRYLERSERAQASLRDRSPPRRSGPPSIPPLPRNISSLHVPEIYDRSSSPPPREPSRPPLNEERWASYPRLPQPRTSIGLHTALDPQNAIPRRRPSSRNRESVSVHATPHIHDSLTRHASRHGVPTRFPVPPPSSHNRNVERPTFRGTLARLQSMQERARAAGGANGEQSELSEAIAYMRAMRDRDMRDRDVRARAAEMEAGSSSSRPGPSAGNTSATAAWPRSRATALNMMRHARMATLRRQPLNDYMRDEDFDSSYESLTALASMLGDVKPRRTADSVIRSLPKGLYKDWKHADSDTRCPICLDDYVPDDELLKVPECSHWLHQGCLEQWLRGATTCPVCRGRVDNRSPVFTPTAAAPRGGSRTEDFLRRVRTRGPRPRGSTHEIPAATGTRTSSSANDAPGPSAPLPVAESSAPVSAGNTSAADHDVYMIPPPPDAVISAVVAESNRQHRPPPTLRDVGLDFDLDLDSDDDFDNLYF